MGYLNSEGMLDASICTIECVLCDDEGRAAKRFSVMPLKDMLAKLGLAPALNRPLKAVHSEPK